MKVGLILIGGALRGIYGHVGTWAALDELGIKPDVVMGASAGSIIGSFYAVGLPFETVSNKIFTLTTDEYIDHVSNFELFVEFVFKKGKGFTGFIVGDKLEEYIRKNLESCDDFSKTKLPFYVTATNLSTKKVVIFNTGTISDKVRASTAVPMLFRPKQIDEEYYVDGAIFVEHLPHELLKLHPDLDLIIISNFSAEEPCTHNRWLEKSNLPIMDIIKRTVEANTVKHGISYLKVGNTDIINIHPNITTKVSLFEPNPKTASLVYSQSYLEVKNQLLQKFPFSK